MTFEENIQKWVLLDNQIITPTLKSGCIDGVMRKYLLKQKNICGLSVLEKDIIISDLLNAKELFFSNVINCVSWVASFRGNVYESNLSKEIIKEINNLF